MAEKRQPPRGLLRLLLRAPIWFYRLRLGWLLGGRFLLLLHTGRRTGLRRQAVLEVVDYDPAADVYTVAVGFGRRSDWYQNIRVRPQVVLQVGRRRVAAIAHPLDPAAGGAVMAGYARRYPLAARLLTRLLGHDVDGSPDSYRRLGEESIPFVSLAVDFSLDPADWPDRKKAGKSAVADHPAGGERKGGRRRTFTIVCPL